MNKYIKLALGVLLLTAGIYLMITGDIGWGIIVTLLSVIPIFLFFRNEFILLAFWEMRKQNLEGASKWLEKIKNPKSQLIDKQMGYFYYMQGLTAGQDNMTKAEQNMRKALDYGLSFAHDRAMAKLNLAAGAMSRGRKQEAKKWLKESKADDTQGMLTDQIKMFEEQMKRMNMGRNMQNPHMRNRGKYF